MKPIELTIMKHFGRGYTNSFVIALNSHLIKGEFPHTATLIADLKIPMEKIADAFSVEELKAMLEFRTKDDETKETK